MKQETATPTDRLRVLLKMYALALAARHVYRGSPCRNSLQPRRFLGVARGLGKGYPRGRPTDILVVLFVAHIAEASMWAAFFWKAGHLASFGDGWYYACVSHTALGYGDVVLSKPWRSLGPLCAINGLLTFGCFTAALFLVLQRVWHHKLYALV
jgi:hypothetical protein